MSKFYNPRPSNGPSSVYNNYPSHQQPPQKTFDNIFNSNSSVSFSRDQSLKPKYFDRNTSQRRDIDKTNSDLDLPNTFAEHEILNGSNFRFNDTYTNDQTMLNMLKVNNRNNNESYRNTMAQPQYTSPSDNPNYYNNYYAQQNSQARGTNQKLQRAANNQENNNFPNTRAFSEPQNHMSFYKGPKGPIVQKTPVNSNEKHYQETQINSKMMEINQLLSRLIPLTEQKKMELIRKTTHISQNNKNTSFMTGKSNKTGSSRLDHASLKVLAKIRKDSSVFDAEDSEDSDEETNVNNIFNNNMTYLNSTLNGACPGRLLKNNANNAGNYSMPVNNNNHEASVSMNYNNRSAGATVGGYYLNPSFSRNQSKTITSNNRLPSSDSNNRTTPALMSERNRIFDKNRSTLTSDTKNSLSYYGNDERLCLECMGYFDKKNIEAHQKSCKNRGNSSNAQRTLNGRRI